MAKQEGKETWAVRPAEARVRTRRKELTEPKKQLLRKGLFDQRPVTHRPGSGACSFRLAE